MTDTPTPDLTAPEQVNLSRALDQIAELNKLPPDEYGYRWDNSDLIAQEVMSARSALHAMSALISEMAPYKAELLKIAETVGEGDDPFAAWEAIEALSAELEAAEAERNAALGARDNAVATLDAWFDRRALAHEAIDGTVLDAVRGYLRTSRSGGMDKETSDMIEGVIQDMARLAVFADLFARAARQKGGE